MIIQIVHSAYSMQYTVISFFIPLCFQMKDENPTIILNLSEATTTASVEYQPAPGMDKTRIDAILQTYTLQKTQDRVISMADYLKVNKIQQT